MSTIKTLSLGLVFLLLGGTAVVYAQSAPSSFRLTTSPVVVNLTAKPGETSSTDLRVENTGTTTQHLTVGLMKFSASGDTGVPELMKRGSQDTYFDWVTFSDKNFDLAPNEWKTVKATFAIPKSAAYGYYYAVTFSEKGSNLSANGATPVTSLSGASAILVLLNVQVPGEKPKLTVTDYRVSHNIFEFLPVDFTVAVKNTGNIHVIPEGNIFITKSGSTDDLGIISINKGQGNVLPQTNRVFTPSWTDGFPAYQEVSDKNGKVTRRLVWDFTQASKLRFGQYQAHMLLVYNNGDRDIPIEGTLSFWVIPWRLIGGGLLIVVLVLAGLLSLVRQFISPLRGNRKHA